MAVKARTGVRLHLKVLAVFALAACMAVSGLSSEAAAASPNELRGEVTAKTAEQMQVQVEDGKMYTFSSDSSIEIKDEEGYAKQMHQVPRGVQVVLHLKNGQVVKMTLVAD